MKKIINKLGFTLVEMLVVVAIMMVLAGVSFIAVVNYQRSMAQFERDGIAKEIFIAAQNHLSFAESEGYLGLKDENSNFGSKDNEDGVYYFIVNNPGGFDENKNNVLGLMLPFGSIDETIRLGGNYVVRYQKSQSTARVLDVFYTTSENTRFGYKFESDDYSSLKNDYKGAENKSRRRNCELNDSNSVLGWYGGDEAELLINDSQTVKLKAPNIIVVNAEKLYVEVEDTNEETIRADPNYTLNLVVTGVTSKAHKTFDFSSDPRVTTTDYIHYIITLDDITASGKHFCELIPDQGYYIPGENITVQAFSGIAGNISKSSLKKSNSIFADIDKSGSDKYDIAYISNIRHLENIDYSISDVDYIDDLNNNISIIQAKQKSDLNWLDFKKRIAELNGVNEESIKIYYRNGTLDVSTSDGCYKPIDTMAAGLIYDGKKYRISYVEIIYSGNAGLFSSINGGVIKNLQLLDFAVATSGSGNAGALVGAATDTVIENVIARRTTTASKWNKVSSTDGSGSAGGLIGTMSGGSVKACAASLIVNADGDAGGLIGKVSSSSSQNPIISACYSAGYTSNGMYDDNQYSVSAGGNAGGLVGTITINGSNITGIQYSYSTCSVSSSNNSYAGGLIGEGEGCDIKNCYATGLVNVDSSNEEYKNYRGAFAGQLSNSSVADQCHYFEIINEIEIKEGENVVGYRYLAPLGGGEDNTTGIIPMDEDFSINNTTYNNFVGSASNWKTANAYDPTLIKYYQGNYNLKTVRQLIESDGSLPTDEYNNYFNKIHYGDWPAPEIFFLNDKITNNVP